MQTKPHCLGLPRQFQQAFPLKTRWILVEVAEQLAFHQAARIAILPRMKVEVLQPHC